MNVTGDPIDERGPIKHTQKKPIHADAPEFVEQSTSAEVLVTGIKVVDLLAPYARGGKIGLFGGAGVGKTVFIQELIVSFPQHYCKVSTNLSCRTTLPRPMVATQYLLVSVNVPVRETTYITKCKKLKSFNSTENPKSHLYLAK